MPRQDDGNVRRDLLGALDEAMNFRGPALIDVRISQGSARKRQEVRWHG
jgi:2-hydroxyacyl-CoA lyase 1